MILLQYLAFGIGMQEIIIIAAIILLLFGAAKLPQLGSAIGQGIRNFKRGMREVRAEDEEAQKLEAKKLEALPSSHEDPASSEKSQLASDAADEKNPR